MIPVVDLGVQFPANNFVREDEPHQGAAPLKLLFCERCSLAQLSVVYDPELLFSHYSYVTGSNPALLEHFGKLWDAIREHSPAKRVLEIGSNTGEFLLYCRDNGAEFVYGIESAWNLACEANDRGILTFLEPYGHETKFVLPKENDVIVARHVFAHIDSWGNFVKALDRDAGRDTVIVIEVPYALTTLQRCELDQLYFEHMSYVSLKAMDALLKDSPFQMVDVRQYEIHGGAIAIFIKRKPCEPRPVVAEMIEAEKITATDWHYFSCEANRRIHRLSGEVYALKKAGKKVVGVGASAKSSVWTQACEFTNADIAFICDNTPQKQGKLSPGANIPIVPESHLTRENADVAILFAWNWESAMREKHKSWLDAGGCFINPHSL